jgi:hypothetical protein
MLPSTAPHHLRTSLHIRYAIPGITFGLIFAFLLSLPVVYFIADYANAPIPYVTSIALIDARITSHSTVNSSKQHPRSTTQHRDSITTASRHQVRAWCACGHHRRPGGRVHAPGVQPHVHPGDVTWHNASHHTAIRYEFILFCLRHFLMRSADVWLLL